MSQSPRPNLFIIGAMKCGTTSLHAYLSEHPEIFMCEPKEPSYFVEREQLRRWYPSMEEFGFWRGEDRYLALFADAGDRPVVGESSTSYTKLPQIAGVTERLYRFSPEARFIYIMRDPVERTISHYWHMVRNRDERRDMLTAIRDEPHFRDVSHYSMQLAPYFERWGRERCLTLTTEALSGDSQGVIRRIFEWLHVDPAFVPPSLGTSEHVTPETLRQATGSPMLLRLRQSPLYRALRPLLPEGARTFATRLTRRDVTRRDVGADHVREFLRPIQREQTRELSALLGREFPEWKTLYGGTP
jgi:Sulfotransferase family